MSALLCLATAVYFEARSEPIEGQYAVAEVIMNRVESDRYPDDVCGVVSEDRGAGDHDCQFSFMCDGRSEVMVEQGAKKTALLVAENVLSARVSETFVEGALFYHTTGVSPKWSRNMKVVGRHGSHIFFAD